MAIKFDDSSYKSRRRVLDVKFKAATDGTMEAIANEILRLSINGPPPLVPHDKGVLQNSASVEPHTGYVLVGFNTRYAARLHEHPEYNFQKGRQGKYLENPIKWNLSILRRVAAEGIGSIMD